MTSKQPGSAGKRIAQVDAPPPSDSRQGIASASLGVLLAGGFYAIAVFVPWPPLQRYFLGHPVAIAATVLFCVALSILATKWWLVSRQWNHLTDLRDSDVSPNLGDVATAAAPADTYRWRHDLNHVAGQWMELLRELPGGTRSCQLVTRLREALQRQARRGNTKHLADDLRELSQRDADSAHDSYGLVRIIVWAIPMLGFLGTVIGITQTLGGLDFTDGTAAVDRLKSGLYVAFDTTALGLVLSVVAIFLQFPVERSEQRLLATIDGRVGPLLSDLLPGDEGANDPTHLIIELCDGIRTAVAESLAQQTHLWRQTIDEANQHWQEAHATGADEFATAVRETLSPALKEHAGSMDESIRFAGDRLERSAAQWQSTLESNFNRLLAEQESAIAGQAKMSDLQRQLIQRNETLSGLVGNTETLQAVQATLQTNLQTLAETHRSVHAKDSGELASAMRVLAQAVDALHDRFSDGVTGTNRDHRRAA